MKDGISGTALPADFPYKQIIEQQCFENQCSPCLVAAIKVNETGLNDPPTIVSGDGGHGLWQLTSSYPPDWADPAANCRYAIQAFITPAWQYWAEKEFSGDDLVRLIAASFNAGIGNAEAGHNEGNVDKYTTNNYAARALANYKALVAGNIP